MELFDRPRPPGLKLVEGFVDSESAAALQTLLDSQLWLSTLDRRTQHYGRAYDYHSGRVGTPGSAPPLLPELLSIAGRLRHEGLMSEVPDQCIVNEYDATGERPQGIAAHRDRVDDFGPEIATISLCEEWVMRFTQPEAEAIDLALPVGSCAVMTGPARYEWMHAIPARKFDRLGSQRHRRGRRISITFRKAIR